MSFLGATGSSGTAGLTPPNAPTFALGAVSRYGVASGSTPKLGIQYSGTLFSPKATSTGSSVFLYIYKTSDNSLFATQNLGAYSSSFVFESNTTTIPLVKGTSYYAKLSVTDRLGLSSAPGTSSATFVAMTRPSIQTNFTATGTNALTTSASWTASSDNGGGTVSYDWEVFSHPGNISQQSGNTSQTSVVVNQSAGNYYWKVRARNELGSNDYSLSSVITVSSPPPPPPPPPFFPPYFPPFFGPSFGPYFCLQADSPVLVWVDGKTLQKKVKDIEVGDKVVSYTFAELPENDSEYSLNSWNSQSMTPLEAKEATVVRNEKLVTQSTVFFNEDQNNRMTLEHLVFVKRDEK
jgi:hypothetical protein